MILGGIETVCAAAAAAYVAAIIKNKIKSYLKDKATKKSEHLAKIKAEEEATAEKKKSDELKVQEEIKKNPPSVIPWSDFRKHFNCPKCGQGWNYAEKSNPGPAYCSCDKHVRGHFHLSCSGTSSGISGIGCKANIIMLAKDSKDDNEKG